MNQLAKLLCAISYVSCFLFVCDTKAADETQLVRLGQSKLRAMCGDCHASGESEGGFKVESLTDRFEDPKNFALWERVYDRINQGEMPPPEDGELDEADKQEILKPLHSKLVEAHTAAKSTVLRRLNRSEYENSLNDLFGTNLEVKQMLPPDGRYHDFDNIGSSLGMSMVHLQQYMAATENFLDAAIEKTESAPKAQSKVATYATTREGKKFIGSHWKQLDDGAVVFFAKLGYPTGMLRGTEVTPGVYKIRVTGYAYRSDEPITLRIGGTSFLRGSEKLTYGYRQFSPGVPQTVEVTAQIPKRYMIDIDPWGIHTGNHSFHRDGIEGYEGPGLAIQQVELIGPLRKTFPSRGHELLFKEFDRTPIPKKNKWQKEQLFKLASSSPQQAAEKTLLRIANLAFRRPVDPAEVAPFVSLFKQQLDSGEDLETSLRTAVTAILCSTEFLYLREPDGWLDDYALATRLSFFLNRSMPDSQLRSLANDRQLAKNPNVFRRELNRLIDSKNFDRCVTDLCDTWLGLHDIEFTSPDNQLYPEFDEFLKHSMLQETKHFVKHAIQENLPVSTLVKSDFAMLNNRLAQHYEIDGVTGPAIRRVALPDSNVRGGLLTQGSILKVSANGTNTSPVVRGVWVMERILGEPPQPPPPGIPGIEPDIRGAKTLREILQKHRELDDCKSCHSKIDPPGFALESFDPIGGFRTRFRSLSTGDRVNTLVQGRRVRYKLGPPVDCSGELPGGVRFGDYLEFRNHLAEQPQRLAKAFVTNVLTFATGRPLGFSDRKEVAKIVKACEAKNYRIRDLIEQALVSSIFRKK